MTDEGPQEGGKQDRCSLQRNVEGQVRRSERKGGRAKQRARNVMLLGGGGLLVLRLLIVPRIQGHCLHSAAHATRQQCRMSENPAQKSEGYQGRKHSSQASRMRRRIAERSLTARSQGAPGVQSRYAIMTFFRYPLSQDDHRHPINCNTDPRSPLVGRRIPALPRPCSCPDRSPGMFRRQTALDACRPE
jgi:hypothetical protein